MSLIPAVSVIIPCLNREGTIMAALRSVLDQSFTDIEVIVVDDGSTDGSMDVVRSESDPRVTLVENPGPHSAAAARNYGVEQARAPLIAFQDSDDLWRPGKLAAQIAKFAEGDYVAVYCGMLVQAADGVSAQTRHPEPHISPLEGDILHSILRTSFISTQTLMVTRQAFDAVGPFDTDLRALEDWEFMIRIAGLGTVGYVRDDLVEQRFSENSITRSALRRLEAQEQILTKHLGLLQHHPKALALHNYRLAGGFAQTKNVARAAHFARAARAVTPANLRYQLRYLQLKALALLS